MYEAWNFHNTILEYEDQKYFLKGTGSRNRFQNVWDKLKDPGLHKWQGRFKFSETPPIFCKTTEIPCSKYLKGLSHEIDFKNFDKNLQNLA